MDVSSKYTEYNSNDDDERPNRPRGRHGDERRNNEARIIQPIRCPMCSITLKCPGSVDVEVFIDRQFEKCMTAKDPICAKAIVAKSNISYITRKTKTVLRG